MGYMLEIQNIYKTFNRGTINEKKALDGVNLNLNLEYGYSIPETCKKVQERVKAAIENMTGLQVSDVNISIASVEMEQTK